jgi:hypothetical protein
VVGRNRENTQENIKHWGLLISGWKKQGKYSGKHQTLGIIGKWLEDTGKILGKHPTLTIIDQWLEDTGKILNKTSDSGDC